MKESFILYLSFYPPVKELSDTEKGQLFDAIFQYNSRSQVRELSPICQMAFNFMKSQFERDQEKYEKIVERNKNNGSKGGRPKETNPQEPKKPSGLNGDPQEPKKADNDNDDDNADVDEKEKKKTKVFIPPTLPVFQKYFSDNGYSIETAKRVFQGYEVAGWTDSKGNKIKNWKQKCQFVWFKPENSQGHTSGNPQAEIKPNINPDWQ